MNLFMSIKKPHAVGTCCVSYLKYLQYLNTYISIASRSQEKVNFVPNDIEAH